MYRIGILEKDETYLERFVDFLKKHHQDSFEIHAVDWKHFNPAEESVQYDALFLGDGVEPEGDIPVNIPIGYLTEQDEADEQHISKYQSMEQIYRRMLLLCEEADTYNTTQNNMSKEQPAAAAEYDLKAQNVVEGGETYRVYQIDEEQADTFAIRMLTCNRIKGIPEITYKDGELRFCITGRKSLYAYIHENNSSKGKQQLIKFFGSMFETMVQLEEYMLSVDRLLLEPGEIFVCETEDEVLIPYIPLKNGKSMDCCQWLEAFGKLCSALLEENGEELSDILPDKERHGGTETFGNLQENAKDSLKTRELEEEKRVAYIIRKRTGEKIIINRNIFKLGKDASYVDYCIRNNPTVSRNHADIVRKSDGFYLVDKGSLNHTFVDGKKLETDENRKLEDGCLMQLADEVFEFYIK